MSKSTKMISACLSTGLLVAPAAAEAAEVQRDTAPAAPTAAPNAAPAASGDESAPQQCGLASSGVVCSTPRVGCSICAFKKAMRAEQEAVKASDAAADEGVEQRRERDR